MAMVVTKLASQVPAVQVISSFLVKSDYDLALSVPDMIAASKFAQNETTIVGKLNMNAVYLDILAQYGAGVVGIKHGLVLSAGTGLNVAVSAGGGIADGLVQLDTSTTVSVTASVDNYIWLKNDGTLEAKTTTAAPTLPAIYLGIATCDGSGVTAVDKSGVVYLKGYPYRETADLDEPTDSPSSELVLVTKTLSGHHMWVSDDWKLIKPSLEQVVAVTANETEDASDYHTIKTNEGATSKPTITLPTAVAGIRRRFIIKDSDGMKIQAATGDTIRVQDSVTASAGYLESTTIGSYFEIIAINATEWMVVSIGGIWTDGVFTVDTTTAIA